MSNEKDRTPEPKASPEHGDRAERGERSQLAFPGRRSFFTVLTSIGTAAVGAFLAVPLVRFALFPLLKPTTETDWSDAGEASRFTNIDQPQEAQIEVKQVDGWRESVVQRPIYVLPVAKGENRVLSTICPHLGCEIQWQQDNKEFKCPCHGSVFGPDGSLIQGPAERGMDQLETRVENGKLMVLYQYFRLLVSKKEVID